METREFRVRLRELRKQAGLSQRELAERVKVDFSYISKIESGVKPHPSEKVILRLAKVLDADRDELMTLAGRISSDIVEMLKSRENLQFIRSGGTQKKVMAANKKERFNIRLRELRKQAGMTQRELADKVNVDFTYISKIESGVLAPPSKSVILKLAKVLNADQDELLVLARRVPSDVTEMLLKNPKMLKLLRSTTDQRIFKALDKARTSLHSLSRGLQALTRETGLFIKAHPAFSRAGISVLVVLAIVGSLLFAPSAQALTITITPPSGAGRLGSAYTFTVKIDIENTDLLPLRSVDLTISNADDPNYTFTCTNLPVPTTASTTTATKSYTGTFGTVNAYGRSGTDWVYATSTSRTGYGYGYQSWTWGDIPLPSGYGYGYGYNTNYVGTTEITYTVSWVSPSGWPTGTYNIRAIVYGNTTTDKAFTNSTIASVTLSSARDGAPAPEVLPGVTDVSDYVDEDGVFTEDVTAESEDGKVELSIDDGTTGLIDGEPLSEISITEMDEPPAPPEDSNVIGLVYDFGPDGATFEPAITLTFTYDPALIPEGVAAEDLVIAIWVWDEAAGEWVWDELSPCTVDPVTNTISVPVSHFTAFAVLAYTGPAAFTASDLVITPAEVGIGETVTINVLVANTGDLAGSYEVTLKINNVVVDVRDITVAGGASQKVTFTTTEDVAGTYAINVDGLTGTFTVKAPPVVPPAPPAPPAPAPPAPAPPVVPAVPAPINWALIGGIIAAVVVIGLLVYFLWWRQRVA